MNDSRDFSSLEKKIGLTFSNPVLLKQALTHRSYLNEHKDVSWDHNERLEFLGDAVLELIITDYLFHHQLSSCKPFKRRGNYLSPHERKSRKLLH